MIHADGSVTCESVGDGPGPGDHWGETWSGSGVGLTLNSSNEDALRLHGGDDGLQIESAADDGVFVKSAGQDGVLVESPGRDGVSVVEPGGDGFYVRDAGDDGLEQHLRGFLCPGRHSHLTADSVIILAAGVHDDQREALMTGRSTGLRLVTCGYVPIYCHLP